jgi:deoxyribose-phosphate aldolase
VRELQPYIEHTLLAPTARIDEIRRAAFDAVQCGLFGLCVPPTWVPEARRALGDAPVVLVTVAGFPTGAHRSSVKAFEAARAVEDGAVEVDMVADLGAIVERDWRRVTHDVAAVVRAIRPSPVKVILETARFDAGRVASAARAAVDGGAAFVKTSTGFDAAGGASVEAVACLRRVVGSDVGIKASGGIRTADGAHALVEAGASRLGTSRGPALVAGA